MTGAGKSVGRQQIHQVMFSLPMDISVPGPILADVFDVTREQLILATTFEQQQP